MDIQTIIERSDALTEVGMTYGEDQPEDRVYLHVEDADADGVVTVFLTPGEAYALMAALGQAVRAVEAGEYDPTDDGADPACEQCRRDGIACTKHEVR